MPQLPHAARRSAAEALELMRDDARRPAQRGAAVARVAGDARGVDAGHASALEHHIERRLRTVAMFERMET